MYSVACPPFPEFLLVCFHLTSKLFDEEESLSEESKEMMSLTRTAARSEGVDRLLLCGDFNQNPYDLGMRTAAGFNATMDRKIAQRGSRQIQGRDYPLLYSPMWSLLGDFPSGPPGTFYHSSASHTTSHWHMLDQFLLSPQLLAEADLLEVEVVHTDGVESLLSQSGLPSSKHSDHLPIRIKLGAKNESRA